MNKKGSLKNNQFEKSMETKNQSDFCFM